MTWIRYLLLAGSLQVLLSVPTMATASLTCEASDRNVEFSLLGNIGRGPGAMLQITAGSIKLKAVRGRYDETAFDLEGAQLVQQWVFEKELRIGLLTAEKNDLTVYLAIIGRQVKSRDEGDRYQGRYVLTVEGKGATTDLKGSIKNCVAG